MTKSELKRLIKIENRMYQIAKEEMNLDFYPIEFDIVPPQKMFEIMAYNIPTNVSNWKYGRNYERQRTIYENLGAHLPYEVVINSDPARAYLMNSNTFGVQVLVMSHVVGHATFFTMNKLFRKSRQDIIEVMLEASKRVNEYERKYGIDEVEMIVDAGHAIQRHSSPFANEETEEETRRRVFEQEKKKMHLKNKSYFSDVISSNKLDNIKGDIELFNQKLFRKLKLRTPVEPTEDLLKYIINNSRILEDWQRDILEILRIEGQYYWPIIHTKYMNEGFAVVVHEKICKQLYEENLLTSKEYSHFGYSNSLVKSEWPIGLNPYLLGSGIWRDIEERWNKGRHGKDWESCVYSKDQDKWDDGSMKGWEKIVDIMSIYTDWFFMHDFLTAELVDKLNIYLYTEKEETQHTDYIRTKHEAEEIRQEIVNYFSNSGIPRIEVTDGNHLGSGEMLLDHKYDNAELDVTYALETMNHIYNLWGRPIHLVTKNEGELHELVVPTLAEEVEDDEEEENKTP